MQNDEEQTGVRRVMPAQKPGQSKQDYGTPREFIIAVEKRFGKIDFDLAAHVHNRVVVDYYGPESQWASDSLTQDWTKLRGHLWLNPEFGNITPWAEKCAASAPCGQTIRSISFLVPASIGANWFARHVDGKARVFFLNGRLSFDGKNPYPKDTILARYGMSPGYEVWRWTDAKKR